MSDITETVRYSPGGGQMHVLTRCAQTGGKQFAMINVEPPGGGPPLHVHSREDELFFVIEGEVTLWVNGQVSKATAGMALFLPRGVPHTFRNRSDRQLRLLIVCTPGDIEPFFDYGLPLDGGALPSDAVLIERIATLAPRFGITILGPSPL